MDNLRDPLIYIVMQLIFCCATYTAHQAFTRKATVEDWPCLFREPCLCNYNAKSVYCNDKQLDTVPQVLNYIQGQWYIDLSHNNIQHIPDRAFGNITLQLIDLSYNNIVHIADNAFFGSEASLLAMHLEYNQLKFVPPTIANFTRMFDLYIEGNPISDMNGDAIFKSISNSLDTISFGSSSLQNWPTSFQYLTGVFHITVFNLSLHSLPESAFDGIGKSLKELCIYSSALESLPMSLSLAKKLYHLELRNNKFLTSNGISPVSFKGLTNLHDIIIDGSPIETIPPIFNDLSGLGLFSLNNVPLDYVNESVFPANFSSMFYKFEFNNTQLERFPSPKLWSKVPNLLEIAITYNRKISTISDNELGEIPKVGFLYLSGNPLVSISDDALVSCKEVVFLYLDNTPLTTIPRAIQRMDAVSQLDFTNTNIVCSCESLGWIKHWARFKNTFAISGKCKNNDMLIKDYIINEIPKCPQS